MGKDIMTLTHPIFLYNRLMKGGGNAGAGLE